MIPLNKQQLLAKFNCTPPADIVAIRQFEAESRVCLPDEYVKFLQLTNGGEGFVGNSYVIFWRVGELFEMNKAYEVAEYVPGLLLFGSDGGGEAYAFDMHSDEKPIVSVPFVGMELNLARRMAPNFQAFLHELFAS